MSSDFNAKTCRTQFRKAYQLYRCGRKIVRTCMEISGSLEAFSPECELFMKDSQAFEESRRNSIVDLFGYNMLEAVTAVEQNAKRSSDLPKNFRVLLEKRRLRANNLVV